MRLILILVTLIVLSGCGENESLNSNQTHPTPANKADILGLWEIRNYDNTIPEASDTIHITFFNQELNIQSRNNNDLEFNGITFEKKWLKYHHTENDTTRYYEYFLSEDSREFVGGTTEGWDGREQKIKLIKIDQ